MDVVWVFSFHNNTIPVSCVVEIKEEKLSNICDHVMLCGLL